MGRLSWPVAAVDIAMTPPVELGRVAVMDAYFNQRPGGDVYRWHEN
jgi:hypothetical protein